MGYNQASAFAVVALILFAAANPLTHALLPIQLPPLTPQLPPIQLPLTPLLPPLTSVIPPLNSVNVVGNLTCPTGPGLPVGPGIPGVIVSLNCTNQLGATVTLGQAVTGVNGFFNITVKNLAQPLTVIGGVMIPCKLVVQLPVQQTVCSALTTATGVLEAVPVLFNLIFSPVLGVVGNLVSSIFVFLSVGVGVSTP